MSLHKLCREGNMKKIRAYTEDIDVACLGELLGRNRGFFGYTPLHEAVVGRKPEVLKYLLDLAGNANVNCRAGFGRYTPLHLAASNGYGKCVQELLEHGADISCVDRYGRTPKETAELDRSKHNHVVKLLQSEGELAI